jgi:hypothetical protein
MKRFFITLALALAAVPALAQVGVSIGVGSPDFYGQIFLGDAPRPALIYPQPVVIAPVPQYVGVAPIYLHVPPGHARHWRKHCAAYNACGRPVYFVRDDWYRGQYVPYYRAHHGDYRRGGRDFDKHYDKHRGRGERGEGRGHYRQGDRHDGARGRLENSNR